MLHRIFLLFITISTLNITVAETTKINNTLVNAKDFKQDAMIAKANNQAIIVMFSAEHCPFCQTMKEEILQPMQIVQKNSTYMIRHLEVDSIDKIIDFDGAPTTMEKFTSKHRIFVTPTLLFFDDQGKEGATRIIGVNTVSLLGYYVDSSADLVSKKIANRNHFSQKSSHE